MKLAESILTRNPCYTAGRKITVKGLMLHSVGCPQPKASVFINSWNSPSHDSSCVHGFIDGNGRVGRLIALKECLRFGLIPFIIEDDKKMYYYRGLSEWEWEKGYLTDTCLDGQDTFRKLMSMFDIQS